MELELLYHLLAVSEYGTLSAAAEALHISQPSLTRSMRRLEDAFGLPLFTRTKNRLALNEAGELAVREARRVTEAAEQMRERMAAFARAQRTISIGSCAPAPMWELTPVLSRSFPGMSISSEMREPEALAEGLSDGTYQLIVMDRVPVSPGIVCREYVTEQLYISLPSGHPLASKEGLYLSELAGQTMLVYSELGVWQKLHDEKMRDIHFIVQTRRDAFVDLVSASLLPNFTTNLTKTPDVGPGRTDVPILDPEARITFYLCASEKNRPLLRACFGE